MVASQGAALAQLLLGGFSAMVDDVIAELGRRGHPGVTATHEFALVAIEGGSRSASELGRSLGVTKQAAAKTITALEELGYLGRLVDPADARKKVLAVTPRGREMMTIGARAFDDIRTRLSAQIGADRLRALEADLGAIASARVGTPSSEA